MMMKNKNVAKYAKEVRKPKNNAAYVNTVNAVLSHLHDDYLSEFLKL